MSIEHGSEDYGTRLRQYINLEVFNHEEAVIGIKRISQSYGVCSKQ